MLQSANPSMKPAAGLDESTWSRFRSLVAMRPGKINLNAGTLSPTPLPVLEAANALRVHQADSPSDFCWRELPALLLRARQRLATYLNCRSADLLLIDNATFGINLVVASLRLGKGDKVLTTDHEYGAVRTCWTRQAERDGYRLDELTLPYLSEDPDEIVAAFERAITPDTRVILVSHVNCTTGLVMPVARICELARARHLITVIDGSHAPGMVPVDLAAIDADYYTANCHKWMMAPAGAGFLHVRSELRAGLSPLITSWGYPAAPEQLDTPGDFGGSRWQGMHEFQGTAERVGQCTIPEAIDFIASIGIENVYKRVTALSSHARTVITRVGLACATPSHPQLRGALTAFDFPCTDLIAMRDLFWNKYNIECPITQAAGKQFLRVSTGWFNTFDEIDQLAAAVREIRG